jgi:hypothetical protein
MVKATLELATSACTLVSTSCSESLDALVSALVEDGILTRPARIRSPMRTRAKLRRAALRWAQQVSGFKPGIYPTDLEATLLRGVIHQALAQWRVDLQREQLERERTQPTPASLNGDVTDESEMDDDKPHPRLEERMRRARRRRLTSRDRIE